MDDKELLEFLELTTVGRLAMSEHEAWKARNTARRAFYEWLRSYRSETGDYYERDHAEPADRVEFSRLLSEKDAAQGRLATARAATRRAIVRAAAGIARQESSNE